MFSVKTSVLHLALILFVCVFVFEDRSAFAQSFEQYTQKLQKEEKLGIPYNQCLDVAGKLGQLLYVNVDGYSSEVIIHPAYIQMVKDLNIGGVLPHFNGSRSKDPIRGRRESLQKLQSATELPLMIGVDVDYQFERSAEDASDAGSGNELIFNFGLGYGEGLIGAYGDEVDAQCMGKLAYVDAVLHRGIGLNQSLGPTIEQNASWDFLASPVKEKLPYVEAVLKAFDRMGVVTTLKHFPYTPDSYNLHDKTEDTRIPKSNVMEMLKIYGEVADDADFAMSTHLWNSHIDPNDMATFSEEWIRILREDLGFKGLLVTDALFMFREYDSTVRQMSSRWEHQEPVKIKDESTIFAARALMAGHDMAFLEGTSRDTRRVYQNLLLIACQDTSNGAKLRERVQTSYSRIREYKEKNEAILRPEKDFPEELVRRAGKLYEVLKKSYCAKGEEEFQALKTEVEAAFGYRERIDQNVPSLAPEVAPERSPAAVACYPYDVIGNVAGIQSLGVQLRVIEEALKSDESAKLPEPVKPKASSKFGNPRLRWVQPQ